MGMFCLTGSTKLSGPSTCKCHCHHWHCSQSCCWKCPPFHLRFLENAAVSINACGAPTLQCYNLLSRLWQQIHWTCKEVEATWTPVYAGAKSALKLKWFLFHHIAHVSLRKRWVVGVRLAGCIGVLCIWVSTDCTQIKTVFQKLSYCQSRVDLLDLYKAAAETTFSTPILPLAFVYVNKVEQWTKTSPRNNLSSCLHFSNPSSSDLRWREAIRYVCNDSQSACFHRSPGRSELPVAVQPRKWKRWVVEFVESWDQLFAKKRVSGCIWYRKISKERAWLFSAKGLWKAWTIRISGDCWTITTVRILQNVAGFTISCAPSCGTQTAPWMTGYGSSRPVLWWFLQL